MENNEKKISTSIQYQISNVALFNNIFGDWNCFNESLKKGSEEMKKYLLNLWNTLRDKLKNNDNLIIKDIDKEVTIFDFNVTYNRTKNGTNVFYFTFPDYDYFDAASKYVALALTPSMPRYYTLEYSQNVSDQSPCWVVGEFIINENNKKHINHGTTNNNRLTWFSTYILEKLESENL